MIKVANTIMPTTNIYRDIAVTVSPEQNNEVHAVK